MSIAVLNQVYSEARRLAIAGSGLACDDFRLKKLIPPLEQAAQKAAVFGTVAKAIEKLVSDNEKGSPQALLDLASLVLAILYTQGKTDPEGPLQPIASKEMIVSPVQMSARVLKPVMEALTNKGGGRVEVIREAFENGVFSDVRLVHYATRALDDSYSEIADFIAEKVLPSYGKAIVPEIQEKIDIHGKGGNARRLRLLHALAPETARPIILNILESGSKEMRLAAIDCLGDSADDQSHLHEYATSKNKEVRASALSRLGGFSDDATAAILIKALQGADCPLAVNAISQNQSPSLWQKVLTYIEDSLNTLLEIQDKAELDKALYRMYDLLSCLFTRSEKDVLSLVERMYERKAALLELKGTTTSGSDVFGKVCHLMLESMNKAFLQRLVDDREKMSGDHFTSSLAAGILLLSPKQFYDSYAKFYIENEKQSKGDSGRRQEIQKRIDAIDINQRDRKTFLWHDIHSTKDSSNASEEVACAFSKAIWDPRWLNAAIQINSMSGAIRLGDAQSIPLKTFLNEKLDRCLKSDNLSHISFEILSAMIAFEYPEAAERLLQFLRKEFSAKSRTYYVSYWLARLIPKLPKTSVPLLEAALPEFPEHVVDEILPMIQSLKTKE